MSPLKPVYRELPLTALRESDQKEVEPVSFVPPAEILEDTERPYGAMTAEQFNRVSRTAVKECVHVIEEALVQGLDFTSLFNKLENLLSHLCKDMARQAGVPDVQLYGSIRENDLDYYYMGLGTLSHCPEEGRQLLEWLSQFPLNASKPSTFKCQGDTTFLAQLYTPEVQAQKIDELRKKTIKREPWTVADLVAMNILDTCITLDQEFDGVPEPSLNATVEAVRSKNTYYVGRITSKTLAAGTTVTLSTFIVPTHISGKDYRLGHTLAVLHPHPYFLLSIRLDAMYYLKKIVSWDARQPEPLSHWIMRFSRIYAHAYSLTKASTWCFDVLIRAFHHFHGFRQVEMRGIPLVHKMIITLFPEDLTKLYHDSFAANPQQSAVRPKPLSPSSSNKYLKHSVDNLRDKIRRDITLRLELHRACIDRLMYRFMTERKLRQKMKDADKTFAVTTINSTKEFCKTIKAVLLGKERDFHTLQLSHWQSLQKMLENPVDIQSCDTIAQLVDDCRRHNLQAHEELHVNIEIPYLSDVRKPYLLKCRRFYGPPPQFVTGQVFNELKTMLEKNISHITSNFPFEYITMETLEDLSVLSEEQKQFAREKARREHVEFSAHHIHFERYIMAPKQERCFVYHPLTIGLGTKLVLIKIYAEKFPPQKFLFDLIDKAQEIFSEMLNEELPSLAKLTDMLAALKYKLVHMPKEAAPLKPAPSQPSGTSYSEIDALMTKQEQPVRKKPPKTNLMEPAKKKEIEAPAPAAAPASIPKPQTTHKLNREDYRVFSIIMGLEKGDVTWKEIKICLTHLGFSVLSKGAKIYQFKFEQACAVLQKEGPTEHFIKASKNFHEPHINRKHTARTPLVRSIVDRFMKLLLKAGMTPDTVFQITEKK